MKLGIGTYTYGWAFEGSEAVNEHVLLDLAVSMDVSLVQIGDNLPLHLFSEGRLEAFSEALQERDISVEVGTRGLTEENLRRYIAICGRLGSGILRMVTDEGTYRPSTEQITEIVRGQLDLLEAHSVILAIENHDRLGSAELAGIIDRIDSPFAGICLDTVNSMGGGEGILTVIDNLGPYTVNLHIKDFGIERLAHKQGFIIDGRIAGEGMLDIPFLLHRIDSYQRCRTCILEQWVPPVDDVAATIAKERWWAEKSIGYLKKIGT